MPRRRLAIMMTTLVATVLGAGCSSPSKRVVDTICVPSAGVRLATIQRDTSYAITRRAASDTLILQETHYGRHSLADAHYTWLIEMPSDTPIGRPVRFGAEGGAIKAWLLESLPDEDTHAVRVSGSVQIDGRTDDGVQATVVLNAITHSATPGSGVAPTMSVTRKALWVYDQPLTPVTPELRDHAG